MISAVEYILEIASLDKLLIVVALLLDLLKVHVLELVSDVVHLALALHISLTRWHIFIVFLFLCIERSLHRVLLNSKLVPVSVL